MELEKNSHEWYEKVYHSPENMIDFMEYIQSAVDRGYKKRFDEVFSELDKYIDVETPALEIGCHLGKTAYWLLKRYKSLALHLMDFSQPAIDYCKKNFPVSRVTAWKGDCNKIFSGDNIYKFITCIDVSEHLSYNVYIEMLKEIARILKPGGHCLYFGAMAELGAHINIQSREQIIEDGEKAGMDYITDLPRGHILFRGK